MREIRERLEEIRKLAGNEIGIWPEDALDEIHEDATKALALLDDRAPTSDTEDGLAVAAVARHLNDAPDHVREAFGDILARLRRTPGTEGLRIVEKHIRHVQASPGASGQQYALRVLDDVRDDLLATQDPNAGGEDE